MTAPNVYQRLAAVMAEVSYIQKEKRPGMQYRIVSHDAVTAKVRPALLKNGIVYFPIRCDHTHNGNRAECSMTVRFVNVDDPSDFFDVQSFGYGIDSQDKGPGKAMSYAVKYALLKALGMETGDDPDHESIEHSTKDPAQDTPQFDPAAAGKRIMAAIASASTDEALTDLWKREAGTIKQIGGAGEQKLIDTFKARKAAISEQKDAA